MTLFRQVAVAALLTTAPGAGWVSSDSVGSLQVATRPRPESAVLEVLAVGTVSAPPEAVWSVLTNLGRYPQTMPHVARTQLLREEAGTAQHWYVALDLPVVSNRDYAIRLRFADGERRRRASWTVSALSPPAVPGHVRITQNEGYWEVEPAAGGHSKVTYYLFVDAGGRIPKFLTNRLNRDAVPDLFRSVERHAQEIAASSSANPGSPNAAR